MGILCTFDIRLNRMGGAWEPRILASLDDVATRTLHAPPYFRACRASLAPTSPHQWVPTPTTPTSMPHSYHKRCCPSCSCYPAPTLTRLTLPHGMHVW